MSIKIALNLCKIENVEVICPVYMDKWGDKGLLNISNISWLKQDFDMSRIGFEPITQESSTLCSNHWAIQTFLNR